MKIFENILLQSSEYKKLLSYMSEKRFPIAVTGLSQIHKAHCIYTICKQSKKKIILLAPNQSEAENIAQDISSMGIKAINYPIKDLCLRDVESKSREYEYQRINTLCSIVDENFEVIVAPIEAAIQYTIPPNELISRRFTLKKLQEYPLKEIAKRLQKCGYQRYDQVDGVGQYSIRGGILDVFSPQLSDPIRIEFFGDQIDQLSFFDPVSQRRKEQIDGIKVAPCSEVICNDTESLIEKILKLSHEISSINPQAYENLLAEANKIRNGINNLPFDKFINLIYEKKSTLFDYLPNGAIIFISETARSKASIESMMKQWKEDLEIYLSDGTLCKGLDTYFGDFTYALKETSNRNTIYMDNFIHNSYTLKPDVVLNFNAYKIPSWKGELKVLIDDIKPITSSGNGCLMLAGNQRSARALCEDLYEYGINAHFKEQCDTVNGSEVIVTPGILSSGFRYEGVDITVISYGNQGAKQKRRKKVNNSQGKAIYSLADLQQGSYVVHSSHGIGIFSGVHQITTQGITKDYIKISYNKGDTLYVPVTQMDMVSKYIGTKEDVKLKLSRLGGSDWQKTKTRVRSAVKDIAKELIKIYSERMQAKGYSFPEDSYLQKDFEDRFEYEETEDQLRSASEIKTDMQRLAPMDRLLCGDVGFGKTEVALRAAFRCVSDGKQCAMLVPTTILAWQHFQTARKRFEGFAVEIELLSRFRTPKQQKQIIKNIKNGKIDFIIGTHRLVQKDVKFKNLGLAIIDEEQRFGVTHKESFKALSSNVDVLTLSATPIPRTLNMAMSGIRDMSTLDEAPQDRRPVQTYVIEYDKNVIFDAIRKELRRAGQVYYLHNKIESIERTASAIELNISEASVGIAHGRMSEHELSEVWRKMLEHQINILVCTTIIETGVDVPNANTLIIDDADHMGLSQLHQLRGRVGRSSRRAYAYFTFRKNKALSEIAHKRLSAIRDFTEFGSGFKIAIRDLELRGAGNIIGAQQHGNMEAVGYDMYLKLLGEALKNEKGEKIESHEIECLVDIQEQAHIPENYISSLGQRLDIYKRISDIRSYDDVSDVIDELTDRFGDIPKQTMNLINIAIIRSKSSDLGVYEIKQREMFIFLYLKSLEINNLSDLIKRTNGRSAVNAGAKPYISLKINDTKGPLAILNKAFNITGVFLLDKGKGMD